MKDIASSVRKVKFGEKITEPGIYVMPMLWYLDDCAIGPSISSSGLRDIENECPLVYWDKSPLNPNRAPTDDDTAEKKHFRIGRAAHMLALEPERFAVEIVTRPSSFDSWRTKEAKAWRADQQRAGCTVLDPPEMAQVQGIAKALKDHPYHQDGILDGLIECSIIWQDKKSGIWLKARPDAIPTHSRMVVDIKTMASAHPRSVAFAIADFAYDMQLVLMGIGLKAVLDFDVDDYAVMAVQATRPHPICVQPLRGYEIVMARRRLRRSINTFAECLRTGYWPGYEWADGLEYKMPGYMAERLEQELKSGLLPKEF